MYLFRKVYNENNRAYLQATRKERNLLMAMALDQLNVTILCGLPSSQPTFRSKDCDTSFVKHPPRCMILHTSRAGLDHQMESGSL